MNPQSNRKGTNLLPIWASEGMVAFGLCAGDYVLNPIGLRQFSGKSESPSITNSRSGHMGV